MEVYLDDVIEAIEFENELLNHFYNKKTGVIIYKEDETTAKYSADDINNIDNFEEWERELIRGLYDLKVNSDDYIKLPKRSDSDEYEMMIAFCVLFNIELKEDENYDIEKLKRAIEGKGMLLDWYNYREDLEKNIAIKWCNENNIGFIE